MASAAAVFCMVGLVYQGADISMCVPCLMSIHNYIVPEVHNAGGALHSLQDQLSSCMGMYVEEVLGGHFQLLLNYVQKAEHARKAQASLPMCWRSYPYLRLQEVSAA